MPPSKTAIRIAKQIPWSIDYTDIFISSEDFIENPSNGLNDKEILSIIRINISHGIRPSQLVNMGIPKEKVLDFYKKLENK